MIAVGRAHTVATVINISWCVLGHMTIITTAIGHWMNDIVAIAVVTDSIAVDSLIVRSVVGAHFRVGWTNVLEELVVG